MGYDLLEAMAKINIRKAKIQNYINYASTIRLNSVHLETESHLRCNIARDLVFDKSISDNFVILQVPIDIQDLYEKKRHISTSKLEHIMCGYYHRSNSQMQESKYDYQFKYEFFDETILKFIQEGKYIFIMFIINGWCIDDIEDANDELDRIEYGIHSTCMFLVPSQNPDSENQPKYNAYYINSHGRDLFKYSMILKTIVSRRRTYNVRFNVPVELDLVHNMINMLNQYMDIDQKNEPTIKWNMTKTHTYLGPNLQAGDVYGVCFIFPQTILHYFGTYYQTPISILSSLYPNSPFISIKHLLLNGNLDVAVKISYMHFNINYNDLLISQLSTANFTKYILISNTTTNNTTANNTIKNDNTSTKETIDKFDDELENLIEQEQTKFIKNIVCSLVRYIKQPAFQPHNVVNASLKG